MEESLVLGCWLVKYHLVSLYKPQIMLAQPICAFGIIMLIWLTCCFLSLSKIMFSPVISFQISDICF